MIMRMASVVFALTAMSLALILQILPLASPSDRSALLWLTVMVLVSLLAWTIAHRRPRRKGVHDGLDAFIEEWPFKDAERAAHSIRHERGLFTGRQRDNIAAVQVTPFIRWCRAQVDIAARLTTCP